MSQQSIKQLRIFAIVTLCLQVIMMGLFCFAQVQMKQINELLVQVNIFIIIGFGLFMASIKGYSYSSVVFVFFIYVITIQFNILFLTLWETASQTIFNTKSMSQNLGDKFSINDGLMLQASCGVVAVLIAYGGIFGKTGPNQILILSLLGSLGYTFAKEATQHTFHRFLKYEQQSGSIKSGYYFVGNLNVYIFGSFYGLIAGCLLARKIKNSNSQQRQIQTTYVSDIISIIGILFLWVFWPSFNASNFLIVNKVYEKTAFSQVSSNIIIQTIFAVCGSCLGTYIMCTCLTDKYKVKDLLIGSIIGGISIASVSFYVTNIGISLGIGFLVSLICVPIYIRMSDPQNKCFEYSDMFGTFSVFGLPAIFGGVFSIGLTAIRCTKNNELSGNQMTQALRNCTTTLQDIFAFNHITTNGVNQRQIQQYSYFQGIEIGIGLTIGIVFGLVAGGLICCVHNVKADDMYDDNRMMEIKNEEEEPVNHQG